MRRYAKAMRASRVALAFPFVVALSGCGDPRVDLDEGDVEVGPDPCPQWLLLEREGLAPRYERREYDDQARLVRLELGQIARSVTGELHTVRETRYEDGFVSSMSETREARASEWVETFAEVSELDDAGRPVRISGWDVPGSAMPNRVSTFEYDSQGRLVVDRKQDQYGLGVEIDRTCRFDYDTSDQLVGKRCEGTNPEVRHYHWDDDGNLLLSELEAETFSMLIAYRYEDSRLTGVDVDDFSRYTFTYDEDGRLTRHEYERLDGLGESLDVYAYDDRGRLAERTSSQLDGSDPRTSTFSYNAHGWLTAVETEGSVRAYDYERTDDRLTVTERWGGNVHETRTYVCAEAAPTGLPVDTNPEPFGGEDRVLPQETVEPRPFPDTL
jgi:YD repeat-containing protein